MALLDGIFVKDNVIDPAKHKFIGTFRSPTPINPNGAYVYCGCGNILQTYETLFDHWQRGHCDVPQYISIINKE